jgi:hypothetical protein
MQTSPAPRSTGGGEPTATGVTEAGAGAETAATAEAPAHQLVSGAVGDRCASCEAPLSSDQSYCLNCGERRGKARFSFASMTAPQPAAPTRPREPRRPRFSSSATLIAGIGTLLLAMGVGVLIGEQGKNTRATPAAASPQVITVQGGGGGGATTSAGSTPSATPNAPAASTSHSSAKPTKQQTKVFAPTTVVITKKVAAKAQAAAQKVFGTTANLAPPTSTVGGSCSNGEAGCQNGHFTGNFFSP